MTFDLVTNAVAFFGLLIALIGAGWAAKSVILSEDDAIKIGLPRYASEVREENLKLPHVQSLLSASRGARQGLWILVVGTGLQMGAAFANILKALCS